MAYKWVRSLDLTLKQLLNLKLQHVAGDHPTAESGVFHYNSTANRAQLHNGTAFKQIAFTDDVLGGDPDNIMPVTEDSITEASAITAWQTGLSVMSATAATDYGPNADVVGAVMTLRIGSVGVQRFTQYSNGKAYERVYSSGAWSSWIGISLDGHGHAASEITLLDTAAQYTATNVEDALAEVLDAIQAHEADTTAAHAASAISYAGSTNLSATTVEGGLDELDTEKVTQAQVDASIAALVDSAPGTLDTLNELAAALGDDPDFATTITNLINARARVMSFDVGDNSATNFTFTHSWNTRAIVPVLTRKGTPWDVVGAEISFPTANTVRVDVDSPAPATAEYVLTITG